MTERARLAVVSYLAQDALTPRGVRTGALVEQLAPNWDVEVISGPGPAHEQGGGARRESAPIRVRALRNLYRAVSIDRYEVWSKRRLRSWSPNVDLAILVGYPFSPLTEAARRLAARGVPFVVDIGDPWALTATEPDRRGLGLWRARRAERSMWEHAAGAIVTTERQADALRELFPDLPILVRPNGYTPIPEAGNTDGALRPMDGGLHLVHFGKFYKPRVDIRPLLGRLAASSRWSGVTLHQYGERPELSPLPSRVEVEVHEPHPWEEIVRLAAHYDLAVAVGNRNPAQLPSKVIHYLTLPIPRLAIVCDDPRDATVEYVSDKPGWIALAASDPNAPSKIADHLGRSWTPAELEPPFAESWERVGEEIEAFVTRCRRGRRS